MDVMTDVSKYIPMEYIIWTTVIVIALLIIVIRLVTKLYPKVKILFSKTKGKIDRYEALTKAVEKNTADIELINQKIGRDYARLNQIQQVTIRQQKTIEDSLQESELILKALLGVIRGLQEAGATARTKEIELEIQDYLLKKSHEPE